MLTSTRRAISYPNPDRSDRPDIPAHILNLINALEVDVIYVQGTNAARLAATHMAGVIWYATDTGFFWWDTGSTWINMTITPPGTELTYNQITSDVPTTATTEGTAVVAITGSTIAFDGTKVCVEFFCAQITNSLNNNPTTFVLLRDTTKLGQIIGTLSNNSTVNGEGFLFRWYDTPAAGSHFYEVRIFTSGSSTGTVKAGLGGSGLILPAYLRVTKA